MTITPDIPGPVTNTQVTINDGGKVHKYVMSQLKRMSRETKTHVSVFQGEIISEMFFSFFFFFFCSFEVDLGTNVVWFCVKNRKWGLHTSKL